VPPSSSAAPGPPPPPRGNANSRRQSPRPRRLPQRLRNRPRRRARRLRHRRPPHARLRRYRPRRPIEMGQAALDIAEKSIQLPQKHGKPPSATTSATPSTSSAASKKPRRIHPRRRPPRKRLRSGRRRIARWMIAWTLRALNRIDEALEAQLSSSAKTPPPALPTPTFRRTRTPLPRQRQPHPRRPLRRTPARPWQRHSPECIRQARPVAFWVQDGRTVDQMYSIGYIFENSCSSLATMNSSPLRPSGACPYVEWLASLDWKRGSESLAGLAGSNGDNLVISRRWTPGFTNCGFSLGRVTEFISGAQRDVDNLLKGGDKSTQRKDVKTAMIMAHLFGGQPMKHPGKAAAFRTMRSASLFEGSKKADFALKLALKDLRKRAK